uniref:Uncharacterized protein n=1 Tax=Rhizophora mucronata TaxID=61149 RepID=A0A2P2Q4I2_RHIMU
MEDVNFRVPHCGVWGGSLTIRFVEESNVHANRSYGQER